jgi:hypothetical protein
MLLISVTRRSIIFVFSFGIDFTIVVNVSTNVGFRPPEEHNDENSVATETLLHGSPTVEQLVTHFTDVFGHCAPHSLQAQVSRDLLYNSKPVGEHYLRQIFEALQCF